MILNLKTLHVLRFTIVDFDLQELCLQWLWLSFIHWFLAQLRSCGIIHWHLLFSFGTREDAWRIILQGVNWTQSFILICLVFQFHVIHILHEGKRYLLWIGITWESFNIHCQRCFTPVDFLQLENGHFFIFQLAFLHLVTWRSFMWFFTI